MKTGRPRSLNPMHHTSIALPSTLQALMRYRGRQNNRTMGAEIRACLEASIEHKPDIAAWPGMKMKHKPTKQARLHEDKGLTPKQYGILVGDIVSGFELYGPFEDGHAAVKWKQQKGNRELTQGQWYLMPMKEPA